MKLKTHRVLINSVALYGLQASSYVVGFVSLPYLARVLAPEGFGLLGLSLSFGVLVSAFIEYGFGLSATREFIQNRTHPDRLSQLAASVMGAKLLMLLATLLVSLVALLVVPTFTRHPTFLLLAFTAAAAQGLNPLWYFQATEEQYKPVVLDFFFNRLIYLALVVLLVKQPGDGWKVLAILTLTNTAVLLVGCFWMYQKVELLPLRLRPSIVMLRKGANLFVQRGTNNLVATLQLAILSTLVSPTYLGTFVGANRLYRVALDLFTPIGQVFVPRLSYLLVNQPRQAYKLNIIGSGMVISFGGCLGIFAYYQADWIVITLLGPEYANSTSVLHILGFALFLYGLDFVLALHWMVPLGLDRSYMAVSLGAGVINLALTILLVPKLGVQGAAWSLTLVELLVVVAQSVVVYRHRLRWLTSVANKP